eukprot:scaffold535_cov260-Pinguiococcus_pyrenoidosus.AAC.3
MPYSYVILKFVAIESAAFERLFAPFERLFAAADAMDATATDTKEVSVAMRGPGFPEALMDSPAEEPPLPRYRRASRTSLLGGRRAKHGLLLRL